MPARKCRISFHIIPFRKFQKFLSTRRLAKKEVAECIGFGVATGSRVQNFRKHECSRTRVSYFCSGGIVRMPGVTVETIPAGFILSKKPQKGDSDSEIFMGRFWSHTP